MSMSVLAMLAAAAVACTALKANDPPPDGGDALDAGDAGETTEADAPAACFTLDGGAASVYVDARAPLGGTGAPGCPLRTITAALAIVSPGGVVHVAAGTYDAAHGEHFPLVVRGVSLRGAGKAATHVVGQGSCGATDPTGPVSGGCRTAILLGDEQRASSVSSLAVSSGAVSLDAGAYGVVCQRGDAPSARGAMKPPSTVVSDVAFDAFNAAIVAAPSPPDPVDGYTACNLQVLSSSFRGGIWGVWAAGDASRNAWPAIYVGDGTPGSANSFADMHSSNTDGAGVAVWDDVATAYVDRNTFTSSDEGIVIVQHYNGMPWLNHMRVAGNSISSMTFAGVHLAYASVLDDFSSNVITGVVSTDIAPGAALLVHGYTSPAPHFPAVRRARGNRLVGNDMGVDFRSTSARLDASGPAAVFDFGTASDAGNNEVRCNSRAGSNATYDVHVGAAANGAFTLSFRGNAWDHAPPTTGSSAAAANGTDAVVESASVTLDTSNGWSTGSACPAGFTP